MKGASRTSKKSSGIVEKKKEKRKMAKKRKLKKNANFLFPKSKSQNVFISKITKFIQIPKRLAAISTNRTPKAPTKIVKQTAHNPV
jgi:hypothetical protein